MKLMKFPTHLVVVTALLATIVTPTIFAADILSYPASEAISYPENDPEPTTFTLSGKKFNDANRNGHYDENESGLGNWRIVAAQEVTTINVNANEVSGTTTPILSPGSYLFKVRGTWHDDNFNDTFDAEYNSQDTWTSHTNGPLIYGQNQGDLLINGQFVNWGSYNDDHRYFYYFTNPTSGEVNFSIFDGFIDTQTKNPEWYVDNIGTLTVTLYQIVTETTTDVNGLYTLTIPLNIGRVNVYEIPKDGWIQTFPEQGGYMGVSSSSEDLNFGNAIANDYGTIRVSKRQLDLNGVEVINATPFSAYIDGITSATKTITSAGTVADFVVTPGLHTVYELSVNGFVNFGCVTADDFFSNAYVTTGSIIDVTCTSQAINLAPNVALSPSSSSVTNPSEIIINAHAEGGNGSLAYQWSCTRTFEQQSLTQIKLSALGSYACTVTVSDEDGDEASASGNYTIFAQNVGNASPNSQTTPSSDNDANSSEGTLIESDLQNDLPDPALSGSDQSDETNVLGLETQTCELRSTISGNVFIDSDADGVVDENEAGITSVEITIFYITVDENGVDQETEVRTVKTNSLGRWETRVCPGSYKVSLNTDDLPVDTELASDATIAFDVNDNSDVNNANFAVSHIENNPGFNWLLCLVPVVILMLLAGFAVIISARERR